MEVPEVWELIAFFGHEPEPADPEEAEFFGSLTFIFDIGGGDLLRCDIGASYGDLRLALSRDGTERVVLSFEDVARLGVERLHGIETLVASCGGEPDLRELRLSITPSVRIDWAKSQR